MKGMASSSYRIRTQYRPTRGFYEQERMLKYPGSRDREGKYVYVRNGLNSECRKRRRMQLRGEKEKKKKNAAQKKKTFSIPSNHPRR